MVTFYGVIIASVYWLRSFIIQREDKEVSELIEKFKKKVLEADISLLKSKNREHMRRFYDDYRIVVAMERLRDDADKSGLYTYGLFIFSALSILIEIFYPAVIAPFTNFTFLTLGMILGGLGFLQLYNYLLGLVSIRRNIKSMEKKISELD